MNIYKKIILAILIIVSTLQAYSQKFIVKFGSLASNENFSGKVILYLSKESKSPKDEMVGVERFPCFSITVNNVKPNDKVVFDDNAIAYPARLSDIERGKYYAQIVWDKNEGGRSIAESPGNIYNDAVKVECSQKHKSNFQYRLQ